MFWSSLQDFFESIVRRPLTERTLAASLFVIPYAIFLLAAGFLIYRNLDTLSYFNSTVVRIFIYSLGVGTFFSLTICLLAWFSLAKNPDNELLAYLMISGYGVLSGIVNYCLGLFSGMSWMVVVCGSFVGVVLFRWHRAIWGIGAMLLTMLVLACCVYTFRIPYAPLLDIPPSGAWYFHQALLINGAAHLGVGVISVVEMGYFVTVWHIRDETLAERAEIDPLTKLPNRRSIMAALDSELARIGRTGEPLSLAILDLDHFKAVNDTYGHPAGDEVLRSVSRILAQAIRGHDRVGRYGGEEFILVLPGTDSESGMAAMERFRAAIEAKQIPLDDKNSIRVTASAGIVAYNGGEKVEAPHLIQVADQALYRAKQDGRNRVVITAIN